MLSMKHVQVPGPALPSVQSGAEARRERPARRLGLPGQARVGFTLSDEPADGVSKRHPGYVSSLDRVVLDESNAA